MTLTVAPVTGLPEITVGADLAALIADAVPDLRDGDILVITSKIVSKAEGRVVTASREQAIEAETARVVARRGGGLRDQRRQVVSGGYFGNAGDAVKLDRGRRRFRDRRPRGLRANRCLGHHASSFARSMAAWAIAADDGMSRMYRGTARTVMPASDGSSTAALSCSSTSQPLIRAGP